MYIRWTILATIGCNTHILKQRVYATMSKDWVANIADNKFSKLKIQNSWKLILKKYHTNKPLRSVTSNLKYVGGSHTLFHVCNPHTWLCLLTSFTLVSLFSLLTIHLYGQLLWFDPNSYENSVSQVYTIMSIFIHIKLLDVHGACWRSTLQNTLGISIKYP